jgi:hypothetical protein
VKKIIATLVLIAAPVTARAQTPPVGKAFETSMLAGSSFGSASCTELTDLYNGNVERAYGMLGELKDYCTPHPDWTLLPAAGRVSMQIAQDATDRYK